MTMEDNQDLQMCSRDRSKVISHSQKDGFREGVEKGKELVFQTSFDKGFEEGLKIGLQLGKYQGLSAILSTEQINIPQDIQLLTHRKDIEKTENKPSRGCCEICKSGSSDSKLLMDVLKEQKAKSCEQLSQNYNDYKEIDVKLNLNIGCDISDDVF